MTEGDEFASLGHTEEHFAAGFVVVAGGGKNGFDGTRFGTFAQKLQDGETVWRTNGTGTEALEVSGIGHREPGEEGKILVGGGDMVGKNGGCGTEGVFRGEHETVALVTRIRGEQEVAASGSKHSGGGTAGMQGIGGWTGEGAGEQNGAVGALGQIDKGRNGAPPAGEGAVGIEDEQAGVAGGDDLFQEGEVTRKAEGTHTSRRAARPASELI